MFDPMDVHTDRDGRIWRQTAGNLPFKLPTPLRRSVSAPVVQGIPAFRLHVQDSRLQDRVARLRERLRQYEDIDIGNDGGDSTDTSDEEDGADAFVGMPLVLPRRDWVTPVLALDTVHPAPLVAWPVRPTAATYAFGTLGTARCDCASTAGLLHCCIDAGGILCQFIASEFVVACNPAPHSGGYNDGDDERSGNKQQRYRLYRECARQLNYRRRRPLPACLVAAIRACYPEPGGNYTGYHLA